MVLNQVKSTILLTDGAQNEDGRLHHIDLMALQGHLKRLMQDVEDIPMVDLAESLEGEGTGFAESGLNELKFTISALLINFGRLWFLLFAFVSGRERC